MNKVEYGRKQQDILESFYKEFFSWSAKNIGLWLVTGIMIFLQGIFLWFPYQAMSEMKLFGLVALFGMNAAANYIAPYLSFTEKGETVKVYDKLKYLPVSLRELQRFRCRKLVRFYGKVFLVFLAGQLFFSAVCYHEITWQNILYVTVLGLLLPLGIGGMAARFTK